MSVYTRRGDGGATSLGDGSRVSKAARRVGCYGDIDELNAVLGVVVAEGVGDPAAEHLIRVQQCLFDLGALLADPRRGRQLGAAVADASWLERWIDGMEGDIVPLRAFILPGGTRGAALAHQARAVCRRAERSVVALMEDDERVAAAVPFLNRLSDALFVLARWLNHRASLPDVLWRAGV